MCLFFDFRLKFQSSIVQDTGLSFEDKSIIYYLRQAQKVFIPEALNQILTSKRNTALKKLTKIGDDRSPAPTPMSSSLQKKFSRGVHYNMKILIKGDRNVGKSCLLQRLQGGPFIEDYAPTDQIQVAPIHWTYKNTDHIVKVEVWEVVDKGRVKKKPPLGLKLENQTIATAQDDGYETPILDATFLDVYKNASGILLMFDITKPWTFEYVVKELSRIPADLPVVVLGNHCDMQHHRQVHSHHIDQALDQAKHTRAAPVRYAESSMRNGFGLRLLHKFFSVPFLRLQKTSLLEQLQRNQKDMEEIEKELHDFQNSDEAHYILFLDRLANKRRQSSVQNSSPSDRSPSIVLGAGKPIVPPNVNPLVAQSLNPLGIKPQHGVADILQVKQSQYVNPDLLKPKLQVAKEMVLSKPSQESDHTVPTGGNLTTSPGTLEEFYAGALDTSFLEDLTPLSNTNQDLSYESDSDNENTTNPRVIVDDDDLDIDYTPAISSLKKPDKALVQTGKEEKILSDRFMEQVSISKNIDTEDISITDDAHSIHLSLDNDYPIWARDSSVRRSPEGGEDPDVAKEPDQKVDKKHRKKKSKDKDRGDHSDKSDRKEKKHKHKKSKGEKQTSNPQQDLLAPTSTVEFYYDEYESI